ncbi:hypothetical protein QF117_04215 [Vibrio sp. YMD68]|uniref:hypothetical protein n=1 Tax=Vibrio TaxID=662 RepID=UPI00249CDAD7|nr:hypothetical protein [Vibrio sp. YMD68]WGV98070.1 hypothetical protein QF117_04215 [Vibrio sp. YMD68]
MKFIGLVQHEVFIKKQIWLYSTFSAVSMAFFLAMLSAGAESDNSTPLKLATLAFSLSLTINSLLSFIIVGFDDETETLHALFKVDLFSFVIFSAFLSFVVAVLFLIAHFSISYSIISLFVGGFIFGRVSQAFDNLSPKENGDMKL